MKAINLFKSLEEKVVSAKKLSDDTGISTGNISDWKSGRCLPSINALITIADYLNISIDYLVGRTNDPILHKKLEKGKQMLEIVHGKEIAFAEADVIVNAANGCGWMGGKRCHTELHKGVAEHLNYYTHGAIEKKALIAARKYSKITSWLFGTKSGNFFVTESCGLKCKKVIHAVTMRYPASYSNLKNISDVIKKIFEYCHNSDYKSIAIPCLGCGTGGLPNDKVMELIHNEAEFYPKINVIIYLKN